jgi:hypothetical protein
MHQYCSFRKDSYFHGFDVFLLFFESADSSLPSTRLGINHGDDGKESFFIFAERRNGAARDTVFFIYSFFAQRRSVGGTGATAFRRIFCAGTIFS